MELTNQGSTVHKGWGKELVWANNERYSGKILVFERAGAKTSMAQHKTRRKSWFVNAGKFRLTYIDVNTGEIKEAMLSEGSTIDLAELSPHQLEALDDNSIIFEVGTADSPEDVLRLIPGDSQTLPQEQK